MYRCEECKRNRRGSPIRVVREVRSKVYPKRYQMDYKTMRDVLIDNGGEGWEIVKEEVICGECYDKKTLIAV